MKKLSALLLVLLVAASTAGGEWWECAGWSSSARARHACCAAKMQKVAPDGSANCCAMSQQSRDRGATESRVAAPQSPPLLLAARNLTSSFDGWLSAPAGIVSPHRPRAPVPLYLQHHSLLI